MVGERARFVVSELLKRSGAQAYRLRDGDISIIVRHDADGAATLNEIFWHGAYDPPAAALAALPADSGPIRIADLGANTGMYGSRCLQRWPQVRIICFEPDPANSGPCRKAIARNRAQARWQLVEACAGTSVGEVSFAGNLGAASHVVVSEAAGTQRVAQVDVFDWIADCDLIKIDIEGSEWELLGGSRMRELSAAAIVLEYHGDSSGDESPLQRSRRLLVAAGYDGFQSASAEDQPQGVVWAWRTASVPARV